MADSIKDLEILALVHVLQQEQVTVWIKLDPSYERPTLNRPETSETSTPKKPPTSKKPSTCGSSWKASNKMKESENWYSPKPKPKRAIELKIIKLILILSLINHSQAKPVNSIRDSNFHFVFEEIGFMAGSTDYQLAMMKVNFTQLEEGSLSHTTVIEVQRQTAQEFRKYNTSRAASHALYPSKQ